MRDLVQRYGEDIFERLVKENLDHFADPDVEQALAFRGRDERPQHVVGLMARPLESEEDSVPERVGVLQRLKSPTRILRETDACDSRAVLKQGLLVRDRVRIEPVPIRRLRTLRARRVEAVSLERSLPIHGGKCVKSRTVTSQPLDPPSRWKTYDL